MYLQNHTEQLLLESHFFLLLELHAAIALARTTPRRRRIRIFNNIFQGVTAATAVPVAVDLLIDSSTTAPGISGLSGGVLSTGSASGLGAGSSTANAAALFTAAGYRDVSRFALSSRGRPDRPALRPLSFATATERSFFRDRLLLRSHTHACLPESFLPTELRGLLLLSRIVLSQLRTIHSVHQPIRSLVIPD